MKTFISILILMLLPIVGICADTWRLNDMESLDTTEYVLDVDSGSCTDMITLNVKKDITTWELWKITEASIVCGPPPYDWDCLLSHYNEMGTAKRHLELELCEEESP